MLWNANTYAYREWKIMENVHCVMSNQVYLKPTKCILDQCTEGKWLIQGIKHCKGNMLQSMLSEPLPESGRNELLTDCM